MDTSKAQKYLQEELSRYQKMVLGNSDNINDEEKKIVPPQEKERLMVTDMQIREPFSVEEVSAPSYKDLAALVFEKANKEVDGFKFLESVKFILRALCFYFTSDWEFEKMNQDWKLKKGIFLWGYVGVGKTTIMRLFTKNPRAKFEVVNCRSIATEFSKNREEAIESYRKVPNTSGIYYFEKPKGVCFDDLGVEREVLSFGNRTNVMEEILLDRYDNRLPFDFTHLTTNLSIEEIESKYGTRVRSRMREMFNILELHGEDLRK